MKVVFWDENTGKTVTLGPFIAIQVSRGGIHGRKEGDPGYMYDLGEPAKKRQVAPGHTVSEFILPKDGVDYDKQEEDNNGRTGAIFLFDDD